MVHTMLQGRVGTIRLTGVKCGGCEVVRSRERVNGKCAVCDFDITRVRQHVEHLKGALETMELEFLESIQDGLVPPTNCGLNGTGANNSQLSRRAAALRTWRHLRSQKLTASVSNGPAWHILMEAYADCLDGKTVYLSSLAASSGLPLSTVSRHVGTLEEAGWVQLDTDLVDRRRCIVSLTEQGRACMTECLMALPLHDL